MKLTLPIVEDVDRAGLGAGELHRLGDNGGKHSLEIERRVHRLRHFAERAKFLDRAAKFIGTLAQFVEQSRVLDRNNRLLREVLNKLDLLVGERAHLLAVNRDRADQRILLEHRDEHDCTSTAEVGDGNDRWITFEVSWPYANVLDVHHPLCLEEFSMTASRMGMDQLVQANLGKCRGYIMDRDNAECASIVKVEGTKLGIAEPCCVCKHGLEHRPEIARRA